MPTYEPDAWNEPVEVRDANNCYNYGTNNKKAAGDDDDFPEPGKKSGKRIWNWVGRILVEGEWYKLKEISCASEECDGDVSDESSDVRIGVCAATRADGLHTEDHCEDNEECWRVAVYYQPLSTTKATFGDFHYVREDTDADGNKTWSHKPGDEAVTNNTFNPQTRKWDGPPITDPETDRVSRTGQYRFCCYLCCCPDTEIAYVPFDDIRKRGEYVVGIPSSSSMTGYSLGPLRATEVAAMLETTIEQFGASWSDGRSDGDPGFRLLFDDPEMPELSKIYVDYSGVTMWNPSPRHFKHDGDATVQKLATQVGLLIRGPGRKA